MDAILHILHVAQDFLVANSAPIGMVLGILFAVAKAISNEKAGPAVAVVQKAFDFIAAACGVVGSIAKSIADALAAVIKSDGFLGKK